MRGGAPSPMRPTRARWRATHHPRRPAAGTSSSTGRRITFDQGDARMRGPGRDVADGAEGGPGHGRALLGLVGSGPVGAGRRRTPDGGAVRGLEHTARPGRGTRTSIPPPAKRLAPRSIVWVATASPTLSTTGDSATPRCETSPHRSASAALTDAGGPSSQIHAIGPARAIDPVARSGRTLKVWPRNMPSAR